MASEPQLLILDDDPTLTEVLGSLAARLGWGVTRANNKDEFLHALEEKKYDAVLTDYRMPEMDGLAVVRHLRWHGFFRSIIVMSAFIPESVKASLKDLNVQSILAKPFRWQSLQDELSKALEGHSPYPTPS